MTLEEERCSADGAHRQQTTDLDLGATQLQALLEQGDSTILVEGHTDSRGSADKNQELSLLPHLSVAENITLGRVRPRQVTWWPGRSITVRYEAQSESGGPLPQVVACAGSIPDGATILVVEGEPAASEDEDDDGENAAGDGDEDEAVVATASEEEDREPSE